MVKMFLKRIDSFFFGKLKDQFARMLEKEVLEGCETLLDVGCGSASPVKSFSKKLKYLVGIDGFEPSILKSKALGIHSDYIQMNVMDIGKKLQPASFDCVAAFDVIEHLTKEDGLELIEMMEKLARKKVIIFTPNGFLAQSEYDGNEYQVHLSGWDIDEMQKRGYRVTGINGWKALKGECARIRWWPQLFWGRISLLSQYLTTRNPRHAFAILCVKEWPSVSSD